MTPSRLRHHVAVVALIALSFTVLTPATRAASLGSLSGRVFHADGRTPVSGVVVSLVDDTGVRQSQSEPTTDEGAFTIAEAASGDYHLLIEAPEGAFLAGDTVSLAPGVNQPVALALQPNYQTAGGSGGGAGGGGLPTWAKWVIAGGIIVLALVVINEINNDDEPASPF